MNFGQLKRRLELDRHFLFRHLSATGIRTDHNPSWSKSWAIAALDSSKRLSIWRAPSLWKGARAANVAVVLSLTHQHDYECLDGNSHQNQQIAYLSPVGNCRWRPYVRYSSLRAPNMLSFLYQFKVCRRLDEGFTRTGPSNSSLHLVHNISQTL